MVFKSFLAAFAAIVGLSAAIPWVFQDKKNKLTHAAVRSFVASDLSGANFSVMTQFHQGTTTSMAPECPKHMLITEGEELVTVDKVLSIPYDRLKIWGTRDDLDESEPTETCKVKGHKFLELAESRKLQESGELNELTQSFDITKVFEKQEDEEDTDEVFRLHRSVLAAMGNNKYYYTGKMDYSFKEDGSSAQEDTVGIECGGKAFKKEGVRAMENPMVDGATRPFFTRGELFLFIDEPKDTDILVKVEAGVTQHVTLAGNVRHMVVTTVDSTCIYKVEADIESGRVSADPGFVEPTVCPSDCTCKC